MKKFLKYMGYAFLTLIALVLLYLGCAWVFSRLSVSAETGVQPAITIYLKTNGVHTDLVLPVRMAAKDWSREILYENTRSGDTTFGYVGMGWGDKGFYLETPTWADLKASTALRAAFGLSSSAIHATFYKGLQEGPDCVRLVVAEEQYQRLIAYIERSLQTDSLGNPVVIPFLARDGHDVRYGEHDAFYAAKGSYNLFHTCNTWTNNALKACGQKACWWTPFDKGIFYQYRK